MKNQLLIVFVKNIKLGKVKTRLAKTIGDEAAFEVYKELVAITEKATEEVEMHKMIYFSDAVVDTKWKNAIKKVQFGIDLGARMQNAFEDGFNEGYESIVLIGSDLPSISNEIIQKGFNELKSNHVVLGPAADGGYYLIGMNHLYKDIFKNKPWSQNDLLSVTLKELEKNSIPFSLLETLNDIDTFEDLITSDFYNNNPELQQIVKQLNE